MPEHKFLQCRANAGKDCILSTGRSTCFLAKIDAKLSDCEAGLVSLESRFDIAYEALLQCGLAALRANGLRPDSKGGHHVLALQTLPTTIGYAKEKIRMLDEFRKQRASGLYDGSFNPSEAELHALVNAAWEVHDTLVIG